MSYELVAALVGGAASAAAFTAFAYVIWRVYQEDKHAL